MRIAVLLAICLAACANAAQPSAKQWIAKTWLSKDASKQPFSFIYDRRPSEWQYQYWNKDVSKRRLGRDRIEHTIKWSDPRTGLQVRCIVIEYTDFPAVDWVVYFKNTGKKNSRNLKRIQVLDTPLTRATPGGFAVHHIRGSDAAPTDFEPITDTIPATGDLIIQSHGGPTSSKPPSGSPSVESMPMFDVEYERQGIIAALGWDGPWVAAFARTGYRGARVCAWMDETDLYLRPGEEIRSPRVLLLFWNGDRDVAHNVWRRLILAHYSPRPGGKPFAGLLADANWSNIMDAAHHIQELEWWGDHDIPMECYWMDAAWTDMSRGWFAHQSNQTPNPKLFPNGMRPIADAAHKRGMKYLLWFVPHSLNPEVGIGKEHPEYLGPPITVDTFPGQKFYVLDHGNPEINRFAIGYFSRVIKDFGVDIFRQDGTAGWQPDADSDRGGMSQIKYVLGFYDFWDGLLKNNPSLLIDNCATGARRLELETMSRSIALHRSDIPAGPNYAQNVQSFNQGMFPWVPLFGGAVLLSHLSAYSFRSAYCAALLVCWPDEGMPPTTWITNVAERWKMVDMDLLRQLVKEYVRVRPYTFGDYYALLPYSLDTKVWVGWQFDRPDLGEGMLQLFRRQDCTEATVRVKPRGLNPKARYVVTNLDVPGTTEMTGRDLMAGLAVTIADKPGSAVVVYRRNR